MSQEELPAGWAAATVDDLGEYINGCAFKPTDWHETGTPIVRIQNLTAPNRPLNLTQRKVDEKYVIVKRDILVSWSATLDVFRWDGPRALVNQHIFKVVPSSHLDDRFVEFALRKAIAELIDSEHLHGSTMKHINRRPFLAHPTKLPPLPEQQRIVEKIETLFAELDKGEEALRAVQKLLARYRQSVLKAAVTGALTADWRAANGEKAWTETTLGELNSFLTSGSRGWAEFYSEQGDTFIRAQNLKFDRLDLDDVAFVSLPNRSEGTRTKVQVGDILITITGANVTKTALVERIDGTAYVSQHVALFRPTSAVHPEFLHCFIVAKAGGRKALEEAAYGAGKPGLNLQNIRDVPISLPPLDEQVEIVDRVDHLLGSQSEVQAEIDRQLIRGQLLRQSILKNTFSGRLVPQDPSDNPAGKLLDRIHAARGEKASAKRKKATA